MGKSGRGKTFVGFGFGPIQSGLFLFEAYASGSFSRFVVAEVDGAVVEAVRRNRGRYAVNIARKDRIDRCELDGIEILNPADASDRARLTEAVAESDEMATALPSVAFYDRDEASAARVIAEGLSMRRRPFPTIIYAAENHNHAAELVREAVASHTDKANLSGVETLNTVIGKMSGVIMDAAVMSKMGLEALAPGVGRAVLVEEFNRILISRVHLAGYRRGIGVFVEKDDLLPFEEAKLYGHNAIHAVIAYLADWKGLETIADAGRDEWIMSVARRAFIDESGAALIARHGGLGEALFTPDGYREYAEDLLERMVRTTLNDLVARVGRDQVRKLGYDDRLYGTMRLALAHGIRPVNLALGAAAAVLSMVKRRAEVTDAPRSLPSDFGELTAELLGRALGEIWGAKADEHAGELVGLTRDALAVLRRRK
jgi:mannitol-1-phosphate 5-dehydrogenase